MKIIMDLHGVLIEKFPIDEYNNKVYNEFTKEGFEIGKKIFGTGAQFFTKIGKKDKYIEILESLIPQQQRDDEMIEILQNLRKKHQLYIVTDTTRKATIETLKIANIDPTLFEDILGIDKHNPKPDTEMYRKIGFGLVIGDRFTDIQPAYELGYPAFLGRYETIKYFLRCLI
jgi:FMN phosphatase YigB (HAD superfamily)